MPPKKAVTNKADLSPFPPRDENFTINAGFRYGAGDHPPLLNQKTIPKGKPGCLAQNRFVITGTLPSLYREDAKALIERYGGIVTGSISGKTDVLLAGIIEVGPKKIQTAKEKNIPIIDEDGLFTIIARSDPIANKDFLDKAKQKQENEDDNSNEDSSEDGKNISNEDENKENKTSSENIMNNKVPLVDKYKPTTITQIVGHIGQRAEYTNFLKNFKQNKQKIFLIQGPCGVGKTTIAKLIPQSLGYTVHEFNASDKRSKAEVMQFMDVVNNKMIGKNAKKNDSKSLLLFDEIDGMSSGDKGGLSAIIDISKSTKIPIVCTMNDSIDRKYETLLKYSKTIKLPQLQTPIIIGKLTEIVKKEGIAINQEQVKRIANSANGDLRYAINLLQFGTENVANQEKFIDYSDVVDATRHLLWKHTNLNDRFEMSFADDSLAIYMQYNIQLPNKNISLEDQQLYCDALDACTLGDIIHQELSVSQNYSLSMPQNYLSCVLPGILSGSKEEQVGLIRAEIPKYMMTYSKQSKFAGYQTYFSSLLDIEPSDVYLTLLFIVQNVDILVEKQEYDQAISFITSLRLTLDDLEHAREFLHLGKKQEYKIPKELTKSYRSIHSNIDYNVIQTAGSKVKENKHSSEKKESHKKKEKDTEKKKKAHKEKNKSDKKGSKMKEKK